MPLHGGLQQLEVPLALALSGSAPLLHLPLAVLLLSGLPACVACSSAMIPHLPHPSPFKFPDLHRCESSLCNVVCEFPVHGKACAVSTPVKNPAVPTGYSADCAVAPTVN
jgi:hypothetical protein